LGGGYWIETERLWREVLAECPADRESLAKLGGAFVREYVGAGGETVAGAGTEQDQDLDHDQDEDYLDDEDYAEDRAISLVRSVITLLIVLLLILILLLILKVCLFSGLRSTGILAYNAILCRPNRVNHPTSRKVHRSCGWRVAVACS
jgi:hypothetical protein